MVVVLFFESDNSENGHRVVSPDKIAEEGQKRLEERSNYNPIPLRSVAAKTSTIGTDREAIAFNAYGLTRFEEGSSASKLLLEEYIEYSVVIITRPSGGDDSVLGSRYRIEFEKIDEKRWQVAWVGSQWKCARGPNAGKWTKQICP